MRLDNVVELISMRPGWLVIRERCRACEHTAIGVVHESCDLQHLECARCGEMTSEALETLSPS